MELESIQIRTKERCRGIANIVGVAFVICVPHLVIALSLFYWSCPYTSNVDWCGPYWHGPYTGTLLKSCESKQENSYTCSFGYNGLANYTDDGDFVNYVGGHKCDLSPSSGSYKKISPGHQEYIWFTNGNGGYCADSVTLSNYFWVSIVFFAIAGLIIAVALCLIIHELLI